MVQAHPSPLLGHAFTHEVHRGISLPLVIVTQAPTALLETEKRSIVFPNLKNLLRWSHCVAQAGLELYGTQPLPSNC